MTGKERLGELYKKYELTTNDVFKNPTQGWTIITRQGIDKIQALAKIDIKYDIISSDLSNIIIKATGTLGETTIQTFGEAAPKNTRNGYPVAIAEKRAMSRAVLKLSGFYALGIMSEEEADDFKDYANNQRLNTGTL